MMSWSPSPRRNATAGLAQLYGRPEWRESKHGSEIRAVLLTALNDTDEVNRRHAAHVARRLQQDPDQSLTLIRQLLLEEADDYVAAALITELAELAPMKIADVDATIGRLLDTERWQDRCANAGLDSETTLEPLVCLVVWLAVTHAAPASARVARRWMTVPTGSVSRHAFGVLRRPLAIRSHRSIERDRAFELLSAAAQALDELRQSADPEDLTHICQAADSLATEIYFASGAFGHNGNDREPVPAPRDFAAGAFPVIELLTGFKQPPIIHRLIETLEHLAPADPVTAFLLVERAISAGDAYTYDSLAADKTIAMIQRYLAEFRDFVITDMNLLTAIRNVLDAFVRVGWPSAVAISYRLGDVFR